MIYNIILKYLFDAIFEEEDRPQIAYDKFVYFNNNERRIEIVFTKDYKKFVNVFSGNGIEQWKRLSGGWLMDMDKKGKLHNSGYYALYHPDGTKVDTPPLILSPMWTNIDRDILWARVDYEYADESEEIHINQDGSWEWHYEDMEDEDWE